MAIANFNFTKEWTDPADFPPVVDNETAARVNMQLLHNETRDFINKTIVPAVNKNADRSVKDDSNSDRYMFGIDNGDPYIVEVVEP